MNKRIGIRITKAMREEMEAEITAGRYMDISEMVREAIRQLLKSNREG